MHDMKRLDAILRSTESLSSRGKQANNQFDINDMDFLSGNINAINHIVTNNLVDISIATRENIVAFLKRRFFNRNYYIWAGQVLVAIHPYEKRSITVNVDCPPNIKSFIDKVWFRHANHLGKSDQNVVISGDSGSGKTYSSYIAIKYIITKQKGNRDYCPELLRRIWHSVPLLTAFGNASTEHNSSSSRFGKFLQLQFQNGEIKGAYIDTYLLEKCRVSEPKKYDGNFHILSLMLENLDEDNKTELLLPAKRDFRIVPKSPNVELSYHEILDALQFLNVKEIKEIQTVLAVILNLGNVDFEIGADIISVKDTSWEYLKNAATLLQTDGILLKDLLTTYTLSTRNEKRRQSIYRSPCIEEKECRSRKNCLMRLLYESLFLWLVKQINGQILFKPLGNDTIRRIGILDIYGFESFEHNTFEQLCINYANEKLQHFFINDYLIGHQKYLDYQDNYVEIFENNEYIARMALLDGVAPSIFSILNEECAMKRYKDDTFVNERLKNQLSHYPHFIPPANNNTTLFSIKHYAELVTYDCNMMVAKNHDKVPDEMYTFLNNCNFKFIHEILCNVSCYDVNKRTLLAKFKKSLDNLMTTLNQSDVHYIKCLKPNNVQKPQLFDEHFVSMQLKSNGVLDILKLSNQNYSIKLSFDELNRTFPKAIRRVVESEMHFGKKYVYMNEDSYKILKTAYHMLSLHSANIIQKWWRVLYKKRHEKARVIQKFFKNLTDKVKQPENRKSELHVTTPDVLNNKTLQPYSSDSLNAEKAFNKMGTRSFTRLFFHGDHVVTYRRLPKVSIKIHLTKTCIPFSHLLPNSELSKGLPDIL